MSEKIQVLSLKVVKESEVEMEYKVKIGRPDNIADVFKRFIADRDREYLVCMCLNTKNKINSIETIAIGSLNSAIITPREVYKLAVLSNAASIVIAHNHPSGDPQPSQEDISITKRLKESGKILGIELLDHIIVGDDEFYSFQEKGLL